MIHADQIQLTCEPTDDSDWFVRVCWPDGEVLHPFRQIPAMFLDSLPFQAARVLLSQGYDPLIPYIVRMKGREIMRTDLGIAAASPLLNSQQAKPPMPYLFNDWADYRCGNSERLQ